MEKFFECNTASDNLLSQSYCDGIQRLAGNKEEIFDFQMNSNIVKQRKKIWNSLFTKYSTMVSEIKYNVPFQPNEQTIKQDISMNKPISVIQFWIDTGYQPYAECFNNTILSEEGFLNSSFADEEFIKSTQILNSESSVINSSPEHSKINEIFFNKYLKVATSSSSINTAAYILANNNITKEANTKSIVEGSKSIKKKKFYSIYSKRIGVNDDVNKYLKDVNLDSKNINPKLTFKRGNHCKSIYCGKNSKEDNNNLKNTNLELKKTITRKLLKKKKINYPSICCNKSNLNYKNKNFKDIHTKSTQNEINNSQLVLLSESDESGIKRNNNSLLSNIQTGKSIGKISKRRKLYNSKESLIEFTPLPDNKSSLFNLNVLKKNEHPILETSKFTSKPSHPIKYQKVKYKKEYNRHLLFSSILVNSKKKYKLSDRSKNNDIFSISIRPENQYAGQNKVSFETDGKKNHKKNYENSNNLKIVSAGNNYSTIFSAIVKHSFNSRRVVQNKKLQILESLNSSVINQFKLKHLTINLRRLPYIYENAKLNTNSVETKILYNQRLNQTKKDFKNNLLNNTQYLHYTKELSNNCSNYTDDFMNLIDHFLQNSIRKIHDSFKTFKTFTDKELVQNNNKYQLIYKQISNNSLMPISHEEILMHTPGKKLRMTENIFSNARPIKKTTFDNEKNTDLNKYNKLKSKKNYLQLHNIENNPTQAHSNLYEYNCKSLLRSNKPKRKIYEVVITSSSDEDTFITKAKMQIDKKNSVKVNNINSTIQYISTNKNVIVSSQEERNISYSNNTLSNEDNLQTSLIKHIQDNKNLIISNKQVNTQKVNNKNKSESRKKQIKQSVHKIFFNEEFASLINKKKLNYSILEASYSQNISLKQIKSTSTSKKRNNYELFQISDEKNFVRNQNKQLFQVIKNKECTKNEGNNKSNEYLDDFKQIKVNRKSNQQPNKHKIEENKFSPIKSEIKDSEIHISSDEECIIPLKFK